jgi:hypothetical protein
VAVLVALDHQACVLQHGHVALHCRERHRVPLGQLGDGALGPKGAGDDVASSRVGEGLEALVEVL